MNQLQRYTLQVLIHHYLSQNKPILKLLFQFHHMDPVFTLTLLGFSFEFGFGTKRNVPFAYQCYFYLYQSFPIQSNMIPCLSRMAFLKRYGRGSIPMDIKFAQQLEKQMYKVFVSFEESFGFLFSTRHVHHHAYIMATFAHNPWFPGTKELYNKPVQHLVLEWTHYAAQKLDAAMNLYANLLLQKHAPSSLFYYTRAAELGDASALYNIGTLYERGLGVSKSLHTALEFYRHGAQRNSPHAWNVLGVLAEQGFAPMDPIECYRHAAEQGLPHGMYNLARSLNSQDVQQNEWTFSLLLQSSVGHPMSMFSLAICYELGIGVASNPRLAFQWYEQASLFGIKEAKKRCTVWWLRNTHTALQVLGGLGLPMELQGLILEYLDPLRVLPPVDHVTTLRDTDIKRLELGVQWEMKRHCSCCKQCTRILHAIHGLQFMKTLSL
jgi:TPR repeat protein